VAFHRARRNEQALPDLLMRELLAEQNQHLTLAGAQRTQVRNTQVHGISMPSRGRPPRKPAGISGVAPDALAQLRQRG